jgi:hypothetical protein
MRWVLALSLPQDSCAGCPALSGGGLEGRRVRRMRRTRADEDAERDEDHERTLEVERAEFPEPAENSEGSLERGFDGSSGGKFLAGVRKAPSRDSLAPFSGIGTYVGAMGAKTTAHFSPMMIRNGGRGLRSQPVSAQYAARHESAAPGGGREAHRADAN